MYFDNDKHELDVEYLRSDLMDYFGTAAFSVAPIALSEVAHVENADKNELVKIARECGFDMKKYCK